MYRDFLIKSKFEIKPLIKKPIPNTKKGSFSMLELQNNRLGSIKIIKNKRFEFMVEYCLIDKNIC